MQIVKAALYQLDIKLGGLKSALQYLDGEMVSKKCHSPLARQNQHFKSRAESDCAEDSSGFCGLVLMAV